MHGHYWYPCVSKPLESRKEWRRTLEGRSETWSRSYNVKKFANPTISSVESWSEPGRREGLQAVGNDAVDRRRTRNHEHEQDSEQEEGDHPAHPCQNKRLTGRKADYEEAEQLLRGRLPVTLRFRQLPCHANHCTSRQLHGRF